MRLLVESKKSYLAKTWQPLLPLNEYTESLGDDNNFETAFKGEYGDNLLLDYSNQQVFLDHKKIAAQKISVTEVTDTMTDFMININGVAETVTKTALSNTLF